MREDLLTEYDYSEEEFAQIAKAMKELPYFAPSPQFADKVMARVRIAGATVPAVGDQRAIEPARSAPVERRSAPAPVPHTGFRRSVPARIAAGALAASVGVTMTVALLVAFFDFNLFVFVSRIFGPGTMTFLAGLASETAASASSTAAAAAASAGTGTGIAVIGSFAAGAVAATAALRIAANASRRAA